MKDFKIEIEKKGHIVITTYQSAAFNGIATGIRYLDKSYVCDELIIDLGESVKYILQFILKWSLYEREMDTESFAEILKRQTT